MLKTLKGLFTSEQVSAGHPDKICDQISDAIVTDCLEKAKEIGFRVLQFNAVVKSNTTALALYKKLGFTQLGTIPGGFLNKDGVYEDIIVHYKEL